MTNADARLTRAMASVGAPEIDPAFVLAVLERAEQERFRAATARGVLCGAGFAAVLCVPLALLMVWAPQQTVLEVVLAASALATFANIARKAVAA